MARRSFVLLVMGTMIFSLCAVSSADVPHMMSYSGNVTKVHGGPLNGTFQLTFSIYPDTLGSPADWTETHPEVVVKHGLFSVLLGSINPIPAPVFDGRIKYLGVQVESDPEMRPLTPIVSVAYAYRAGDADTDCEDCDERFVNVQGPDSVISTDPTQDVLTVKSLATGLARARGIYVVALGVNADGIAIDTAGRSGLIVRNTGSTGIRMDNIHSTGMWMDHIDYGGIFLQDIGSVGIDMNIIASDGIYMAAVRGSGIYVMDAADDGLSVRLANTGVYVDSTRIGHGVWVRYSQDDGLRVGHADNDGVSVGHADDDGIYVEEAADYGIWAHGNLGNRLESENSANYGLYVSSYENNSSYPGLHVDGTAYSTGGWATKLSGSSGDVPAFSVVSRNVEVIASGTGTLVDGQANITFDQEFQEVISGEIPVKVVLTAQGAPSGLLYVVSKSNQGFSVDRLETPQLSTKTDHVSFDWIAIGRQKGYEEAPKVLIPSEEEMRADDLRQQEKLDRDALHHQQMLERQTQREMEKREREGEERGALE